MFLPGLKHHCPSILSWIVSRKPLSFSFHSPLCPLLIRLLPNYQDLPFAQPLSGIRELPARLLLQVREGRACCSSCCPRTPGLATPLALTEQCLMLLPAILISHSTGAFFSFSCCLTPQPPHVFRVPLHPSVWTAQLSLPGQVISGYVPVGEVHAVTSSGA